jgi:hypothetical protein
VYDFGPATYHFFKKTSRAEIELIHSNLIK